MWETTLYFGRNETGRRCRDMLCLKGVILADDVAVQAILHKHINFKKNRKVRTDFFRRILVTLNNMRSDKSVAYTGRP